MADNSFTSRPLFFIPDSGLSFPENISGGLTSTVPTDLSGSFQYKVSACNGGESLPSTGILEISGENSGINVYFDLVSGATDYKLFRSVSGQNNYFYVAEGTGSPILDENLFSGEAPSDTNTSQSKNRGLPTLPTKFFEATGNKILVKELLIANGHENTLSFNIHFVPSGEPVSYGNKIFKGVSLEQYETKMVSLNTVLDQGDAIYANANAVMGKKGFGAVTLKISGIEIS